MDELGAKKLIAAILKQAYDDYTTGDTCPEWCEFKGECEDNKYDINQCDAKNFLHSAWCASLCEGLDLEYDTYVKACIDKHLLSKNTYRYTENEIKNYKDNIKELSRLKDNLILTTPEAQEIRGSCPGDSTLNKVIKISQDKQIAKMEKSIKAIDKVYNNLSSDKKAVMDNFWQGRYTNRGLADKICVSERSIKRWRRQIVYSVAIELNYL